MYLAGILALWALLHVPISADVSSGVPLFAYKNQAGAPDSQQKPSSAQDQPAAPNPQSEPSKPDDSKSPAQQAAPSQPSAQPQAGTNQTQPGQAKKPPHKKRKAARETAATGPDGQKKVVHRGGTTEPTTQLTPQITDEQAAKERQNTNDLLASTDASLQKLSGRQLTKDEEDTVTQIRKFMEQVKEADKSGDLQRAYKLAVKAHLLSDALVKP